MNHCQWTTKQKQICETWAFLKMNLNYNYVTSCFSYIPFFICIFVQLTALCMLCCFFSFLYNQVSTKPNEDYYPANIRIRHDYKYLNVSIFNKVSITLYAISLFTSYVRRTIILPGYLYRPISDYSNTKTKITDKGQKKTIKY